MLPINVMYDSGIDKLEEAAVLAALQEMSMMFPVLRFRVYGKDKWCEGEYSCADWYIHSTPVLRGIDGSPQLDADYLVNLIKNEPWQEQEPHIDVVLTSQDITAHDRGLQLNFVFGLADDRISVQSVYRYRELSDGYRFLSVKAVVLHELGHIFGAAKDLNRSNTEYNLGPHCTNFGCVMRQGLSLPEWAEHALDANYERHFFCPQCMADIRKTLER